MKKNSFKEKKVLITGGLGFIGSNLAHALVKEGAIVTLLDSMIPGYGGNEANIEEIRNKVRVNYADMRDQHAIPYLVKDQDYIFNLAGQISHMDSVKDPISDLEINAKSQLFLLEACRHHNPSVKVIFASTRQIYGKTAGSVPIDESHSVNPTDINGVNKLAGELFHRLYSATYSLNTISLRLTNCYGPRQLISHDRQGFIAWFINRTLLNEKILLYGDGSQIRDFTYIDDAISALLLSAEFCDNRGEVFNLGGIKSYTLLEVVQILKSLNPKLSYTCIPFPKERKKIDIGNYVGNWTKIKRKMGWRPTVDLKEGLTKTLAFYRSRLDEYL